MAATPMLAEAGSYISNRVEQQRGLTHYLGQDSDANEMKSESKEFVFVAGSDCIVFILCLSCCNDYSCFKLLFFSG